jgi:hypothetical protein
MNAEGRSTQIVKWRRDHPFTVLAFLRTRRNCESRARLRNNYRLRGTATDLRVHPIICAARNINKVNKLSLRLFAKSGPAFQPMSRSHGYGRFNCKLRTSEPSSIPSANAASVGIMFTSLTGVCEACHRWLRLTARSRGVTQFGVSRSAPGRCLRSK